VVSEATGEPLSGATVTLSRHFESAVLLLLAEEDSALPPIMPVKTNDRGEFSFEGLGPSAYDVTVLLDGYMPLKLGRSEAGQPAYLTLAAGQRLGELRLGLTRSARLDGRIQTASGQTLAGVPLQLIRDDASTRQRTEPVAQASSGADGRYDLTGFLPGRYILIAGYPLALNGERAQSFASRIDVPGVDVQTLDFSLEDRGSYSIRGKLSMDGTSVVPAGARLSIRAAWASGTSPRGGDTIASNYDPKSGTFEIPGLYPGIYEINVSLMDPQIPGYCAAATVLVLRGDVSPVDLTMGQCL
jgi:Carboxypeptidase regulatory-like domain